MKMENLKIEEAIHDIKELIEKEKINSIEEVEKYLKLTKLTDEEKSHVLEQAETYLSDDYDESDIVQIRNQIISIIRQTRSKNEDLYINFNVKRNQLGFNMCKISINMLKANSIKHYKISSFYYNDEFKKQMIEAIIDEVVLNNYLEDYHFDQAKNNIETLYNYYIKTFNNIHINIFDIEKEYAYYLRQKINELKVKKRQNVEARAETMEADGIENVKEDKSLSRIKIKNNSY